MFGSAGWIGKAVALVAVVSGIGALNGWTLVTAEMPFAAAKDGLSSTRSPRSTRKGTPWFGIVVSDDRRLDPDGLELQRPDRAQGVHVPRVPVGGDGRHPVLLLGLRPAGLPGLPAPQRSRAGTWPADIAISATSMLFALWVTFASGYQAVYQATLLVLVGIPLYSFLKAAVSARAWCSSRSTRPTTST